VFEKAKAAAKAKAEREARILAEKIAAEKARVLAELKAEAEEKAKVDSMTIVEATEYMRTKDGKKAE
jgi:F0F1-type ATP synthase membrane subunit b/b'